MPREARRRFDDELASSALREEQHHF